MTKLLLPDYSRVVLTGETDPIQRHYQPVVRYFMNRRLTMALALIGDRRFRRLLDAGYGGGVFLPELARHADALHGVDIHPHEADVARMAQAEGLRVELRRASVTSTGYPDGYFDAIVCVSVLEFVDDLAGAMGELHRVAAPGATVVLAFPGENVLTTLGYRLARTPDPRRVHRANYRTILAEAGRRFALRRLLRFPSFVPSRLALFFAVELTRPGS